MCLITTETKPTIAKQNIVVYKWLLPDNGKLISPVIYFKYKLRKTYKGDLTSYKNNTYYAVIEGFHAILSLKQALAHNIALGINSLKLYKCVIPKGSNYYTDNMTNSGDIASDTIIIKRRLLFNKY